MSQQAKKYRYQLKKKVVQLYYEGQSVSKLTEEYDLSHRNRIYEWPDKVIGEGYEALIDQRGKKSQGRPSIQELDEDGLRRENEHLKLQVLYLKKLLDLERG